MKSVRQPGETRTVWTAAEDDIILGFVQDNGPRWVDIATLLPGRTEHAARNRFHRLTARAIPSEPSMDPSSAAERAMPFAPGT